MCENEIRACGGEIAENGGAENAAGYAAETELCGEAYAADDCAEMRSDESESLEEAEDIEESAADAEAATDYTAETELCGEAYAGDDCAEMCSDESESLEEAEDIEESDADTEAATDYPAETEMSGETDTAENLDEHSDDAVKPSEICGSAEPAPEFDFSEAEARLLALQQRIRGCGIPVVIVIEGWAAAGKGKMAGELIEGLDPRGYKVHVHQKGGDKALPPLAKYWNAMPKAGDISIFIGSWYHDACAETVGSRKGARSFDARLERINLMEHMLECDGALILKFFINISEKEQKRRIKALEASKLTRRLVSKTDKAQNADYDEWRGVYNHMLAATGEAGAEWRVLSGKDKRECKKQMYTAVIGAFERAIALRESGERPWDTPSLGGYEPIRTAPIAPLCDYETARTLDEPYKQAMDEARKKLRDLQYELFRRDIPVVLAFEGWDAAGKGGAIRRLTSAFDARGFTVVPISAPTPEEKAHHHLWRFWRTLPEAGHITIFDRTWYGRVMVERLEGFCTENQWKRAYEEMNLFERDLTESGAIVLKFWLQISNDEQLRRFIARRDDPAKQWKITDEDWRNREKWAQYEEAVNDMLQKTNTRRAPWIVVEGDCKQFARLKVMNAVIAAIEARLR